MDLIAAAMALAIAVIALILELRQWWPKVSPREDQPDLERP
jgi:hypothetical protein